MRAQGLAGACDPGVAAGQVGRGDPHADLERDIGNKRNLGDIVTASLAVILGALGIMYKP